MDLSTPLLERLRALELELQNEDDSLESIGLILVETPWVSDYNQTPSNSFVFATTGCEGVHFGVLGIEGQPLTDRSPVVMTVPGMLVPEESNVIVGGTLEEFLALGAQYGFDSMADLATSIEDARAWFARDNITQNGACMALRRTFMLGPALRIGRYEELQKQYGAMVRFRSLAS